MDLNAIDALHKLRLEDRFAPDLAAFAARVDAGAVDAGCDGRSVNFEDLVGVDVDKEAVCAAGEGDGDVWYDLDVGVGWREVERDAVHCLLLVGEDVD